MNYAAVVLVLNSSRAAVENKGFLPKSSHRCHQTPLLLLQTWSLGMKDILLADLEDPQHRKDVLAINIALQEEGFLRHGLKLPEDQRQKINNILLGAFESDSAIRIFLAYQGSKCVGISLCEVRFSTYALKATLYCQDLWVEPEFRKQGIARALIEIGMDYVQRNDFARMELTTTANNQAAGKLYQGLGFSSCAKVIADQSMANFLESIGEDPAKHALLLKWEPSAQE